MEELLKTAIEKFNDKCKTDMELQKNLKDLKRTVQIVVVGDNSYKFTLQDCHISDFSVGTVEKPDVHISSDAETMKKLINKEMSALKAYALKKIRIKASMEDLLMLKKLF
jgi:putative sterol carrier protein